MTNNTKILRYDLDRDLQLFFDQLDELKADQKNTNLVEIFKNINLSMLGDDEKKSLLDLIIANKKTGKTTIERIEMLEKQGGYSVDSLIEGDYKESFEYNADGEIVKHTAIGDVNFVTEYGYGPLVPVGSGGIPLSSIVLTSSSSKFISSEGRNVEVKKEYEYDATENIVGINTKTIMDVTPPGSVTLGGYTTGFDTTSKPYVSATWTNPTDADFSHVNAYLVDSATSKIIDVMPNIKTTTLKWDLSKLPAGTIYALHLKTVDTQKNEQVIGLAVSFRTPSRV